MGGGQIGKAGYDGGAGQGNDGARLGKLFVPVCHLIRGNGGIPAAAQQAVALAQGRLVALQSSQVGALRLAQQHIQIAAAVRRRPQRQLQVVHGKEGNADAPHQAGGSGRLAVDADLLGYGGQGGALIAIAPVIRSAGVRPGRWRC